MGSKKKNIAVIDTNVFIGAGDAPFRELRNTEIVIPIKVLQELEHHRSDSGGAGFSCRTVLHYLERLRTEFGGSALMDGARSYNGNIVRIESDHADRSVLGDLDDGTNDCVILAVVKNLSIENGDKGVELITNDLPMRLKADTFLHVPAVPYGKESLKPFTGRYDVSFIKPLDEIDDDEIINAIKSIADEDDDSVPYRAVVNASSTDSPVENTIKVGDSLIDINQSIRIGKIRPKNMEQQVAMMYLLDEKVTVLSLGGIAGAGKSMLALAAGMQGVRSKKYDKVLVFRSMYEVGQQKVGFLPGDLDQKMEPWSAAVWDNIAKIDKMSGIKSTTIPAGDGCTPSLQSGVRVRHADDIEVQPISYIRGRTFDNSFIIVDDAQSLELNDLITILTRAGHGTKVVFTFDMDQQDNPNPHMSKGTSIIALIDMTKDNPMFAHLDFTISERSRLAQFASSLLGSVETMR